MSDRSPSWNAAGTVDRPVTGIALVAVGVLVFSSYNALGKWLAADYSPWQIMFFRGLFALLPFAAYALASRGIAVLRSRQPGLQVLRAAFGFGANLCFIFAYREMLVGFVGVLLITRPGGGLLSAGALYALAGTLCYSLLVLSTRRLGMYDNVLCTVIYSSGLYALACLVVLPLVWVTPDVADSGWLVATGLLGGSGMYLFVQAYRHADAAVLAPFDYTAMLWVLIWGEVPAPTAIAGMAIIAGSGLFLTHHERMRRFRAVKP